MTYRIVILIAVLLAVLGLAGCAGGGPLVPTAMEVSPATPQPTPTPEPVVTLYYEENAQVELISPEGTRVLIDITEPRLLTSPATDQDILLTSHDHIDHVDEDFQQSFPGKQLYIEESELSAPGVTIKSIFAKHDIEQDMGTDTLFVVEMGGLRIVHFGDIDQETFTDRQLAAMGQIDVAISLLAGPNYAPLDPTHRRMLNLIDEMQARLVIPTHVELDAVKMTFEHWPAQFVMEGEPFVVSTSMLPEETTFVYMGRLAAAHQNIYNSGK